RLSQPLAVVKSRFDFVKQSHMFSVEGASRMPELDSITRLMQQPTVPCARHDEPFPRAPAMIYDALAVQRPVLVCTPFSHRLLRQWAVGTVGLQTPNAVRQWLAVLIETFQIENHPTRPGWIKLHVRHPKRNLRRNAAHAFFNVHKIQTGDKPFPLQPSLH